MEASDDRRPGLVLGIDAANLRRGGGITHLVEMLSCADPGAAGIATIVVWGAEGTLADLPERSWLRKRAPPALRHGLLRRAWWQRVRLSREAHAEGCDALLVPGGTYAGNFRPAVTMSRNLLPFEWRELRRYSRSPIGLRLLLLRLALSRSFRRVEGIIFLTGYAMDAVLKVTGPLPGATAVIPHGIDTRFRAEPKPQRPISEYSATKPLRLLYVSIIDQYKHQWHVVEAVHALRAQGMSVVLDLVGPSYAPSLARMRRATARFDPQGTWVHYRGAVPHDSLPRIYAEADIGVFASSCENMPNILLETMAAGLPVACSMRGPMPEVLGDAGVYFDPEEPAAIARSMRRLIEDPALRARSARACAELAASYSWSRCARETLCFVAKVARAQVAA